MNSYGPCSNPSLSVLLLFSLLTIVKKYEYENEFLIFSLHLHLRLVMKCVDYVRFALYIFQSQSKRNQDIVCCEESVCNCCNPYSDSACVGQSRTGSFLKG